MAGKPAKRKKRKKNKKAAPKQDWRKRPEPKPKQEIRPIATVIRAEVVQLREDFEANEDRHSDIIRRINRLETILNRALNILTAAAAEPHLSKLRALAKECPTGTS